MQRAADLLVDCLVAHGLDRLFCVPGESYLALLDALAGRREIDVLACRHEGGAGFMHRSIHEVGGITILGLVVRFLMEAHRKTRRLLTAGESHDRSWCPLTREVH